MTRTPFVAAASPLAPTPSLLGAALAGLLCLAGCSSNDSPSTPGTAGDASHAGTGNVGGAESEGGSAGSGVGGDATTAGSSSTGGDASAGSAAGGVGSAGDSAGGVPSSAGAGGASGASGAGGAAEEPPHITSSENVGALTEEQFKALCDARDGTVEVMPHCGGFATAAGFSYDNGTELLSEHTCAGANTCGGWNCVVPE